MNADDVGSEPPSFTTKSFRLKKAVSRVLIALSFRNTRRDTVAEAFRDIYSINDGSTRMSRTTLEALEFSRPSTFAVIAYSWIKIRCFLKCI